MTLLARLMCKSQYIKMNCFSIPLRSSMKKKLNTFTIGQQNQLPNNKSKNVKNSYSCVCIYIFIFISLYIIVRNLRRLKKWKDTSCSQIRKFSMDSRKRTMYKWTLDLLYVTHTLMGKDGLFKKWYLFKQIFLPN